MILVINFQSHLKNNNSDILSNVDAKRKARVIKFYLWTESCFLDKRYVCIRSLHLIRANSPRQGPGNLLDLLFLPLFTLDYRPDSRVTHRTSADTISERTKRGKSKERGERWQFFLYRE